jgi:murein DD-endopeptidase MepM/ murein hydrolase activator NlpD
LTVAAVAAAPAHGASAEIAALQVAMSAEGLYPHRVDGISGPWTQSAVRTFQARNGLAVDGVAGPQTRAALGKRGKPSFGSRPMRNGHRGWDVAALQFLLSSRGFGQGGLDGGFGPGTQAAVRSFQGAASLSVDGVAGAATIGALRGGTLTTASPSDPVRFLRPLNAPIGDGFGWTGERWHNGLDFPASKGAAVGAAGRGTVAFAAWNNAGYGYLVVVRHRLGYETWYAHLSRVAAVPGTAVAGGSLLGYVGSTGYSTGPHLHFEARRFGTPVDPMPRLLDAVSLSRAPHRAGNSRPSARPRAEVARGGKTKGRRPARRRCRPNADARGGRNVDPARARIDRCP